MMEMFSLTHFILMDSLLTQNDNICLVSHNFLHFVHNFLQYGYKISLMYIFTAAGKCKDSVPVALTRVQSLFWLRFQMNFLGEPFEGIRWHSSTKFLLAGVSIAYKISSTFFQCPYPPLQQEFCDILWHSSFVEYYQFVRKFIICIPRNVKIRLKFAQFSFQLIQVVLWFIKNFVEFSLVVYNKAVQNSTVADWVKTILGLTGMNTYLFTFQIL